MAPTIREYDDPGRAGTYGKRPATTRAEHRSLARLLGEDLRGRIVVDVPCGNGRLGPFLAARGVRLLVGIDGARAMASRAGEPYDLAVTGDAFRLPLPDRAVDVVVSVRLLHHFPLREDRTAILAEFSRVARERVLFTFYRFGTLEGLRRRLRPKRPSGRIGLSLGQVREEAREAGLAIRRVVSLCPLLREQTLVLAVPVEMP